MLKKIASWIFRPGTTQVVVSQQRSNDRPAWWEDTGASGKNGVDSQDHTVEVDGSSQTESVPTTPSTALINNTTAAERAAISDMIDTRDTVEVETNSQSLGTRLADPADRSSNQKGSDGLGRLNSEQQRVFDYIERTNSNLFITGRAGSGKSFLLRYLATKTRKQAIVVAPTGVAALNANGATIHSTFQLPWGFLNERSVRQTVDCLKYQRELVLRKIDLLIIDEVSMVPADMLLALYRVLRIVRETDVAFGGVQVILFGDPFQLEPVVTEKSLKQFYSDVWGSPYFFSSPAWKNGGFGKIELNGSHRQSEVDFLEALDAIRRGTARFSHLELLNSRHFPEKEVPVSGTIRLSSTNHAVNQYNMERLTELPGPIHRFVGSYSGKFDKDLKRIVAPDILELKVGAQVMMLVNDESKRWVNGSTAEISEVIKVEEAEAESIWIEIDHSIHQVGCHSWNQFRHVYDRFEASIVQEKTGSFSQYPMTLGWARTIHKSQGQTYDSCVFDLRDGVFASGQAYVALSRCRTLDGLYLNTTLEKTDIRVDTDVSQFMSDLTPASQLPAI